MQMPVIVGVLVGIIFLVAFSEWFYHLVSGMKEYVLDDIYFRYRIAGFSAISILVMFGTFYGLALVNECPKETGEGIFANLKCAEYLKIKVEAEKLLFSGE
jgi:hypothetical protein